MEQLPLPPRRRPPRPARKAAPRPAIRPLLLLPERIAHGRPLRLAIRAIIAAALSLVVLALIPGTPAAPADVAGLVLWFALTARSDLAPAAPPLTVRDGARCRVVRFFTHLPGAGPSPGKAGGPGRTHKGRARAARPRRRAYGPPAMPGPAPARTPAKQPPAAPAATPTATAQMPPGKEMTTHAGNAE